MKLYIDSFPAEERRDWTKGSDLLDFMDEHSDEFEIQCMRSSDGTPVAFMTVWNLGRFRYAEHLMASPQLRGGGIGGRLLDQVCSASDLPLILEVEPPAMNDMAQRRIGFYLRHGFTPHYDIEYLQPPYSAGKPEVPLVLMSHGGGDGYYPDAASISLLKSRVYGVQSFGDGSSACSEL